MRRVVMLVALATALAACSDGVRVVPKEYRKPIRQAAQQCPELKPRLLAAQLDAESKFTPDAVSPAGAEGIAQFVPETWSRWGRDLDGDGSASPFDAEEAIDAQARLMCFLVFEARTSGIPGDEIDLALAGYNAGWSQVARYGGIPPFPETEAYVERIRDRQGSYRFRG